MTSQPLASLVIITYNQEEFVLDAVRGALNQTYSPLEIVITDDCSKDRTFEVISDEVSKYHGSHKIVLNKNSKNLGLSGNLNRGWELSTARYVIVQAGDDISLPTRVAKIMERFCQTNQPVDLVCSYFEEIDASGNSTGFIKTNVAFLPDRSRPVSEWRCGATGACAAYDRKLIDKYGPVDTRVHSEDAVFPFRAWLENGIAVIREPLLLHRTHDSSISFIHKGIRRIQESDMRRKHRRRGQENELGIAEEWLRAWKLNDGDQKIEMDLQRLVKLREFEFLAFDSSRIQAVKLAVQFLLEGGGLRGFARILTRHVLRWD